MDQVSPPDSRHWRNLIEVDAAARCRRVGWVAVIGVAAECEALIPGFNRVRRDGVSEIRKQPGADMKGSCPGKNVVVNFDRSKAQMGVIVDAIFIEVATVAENIEPSTQIGAMCDPRGDLGAYSQE